MQSTRLRTLVFSTLFVAISTPALFGADGQLDPTFGTAGLVATPLGPYGLTTTANDVAMQPDGKFVAAGAAGVNVGLARYNPNGTLDTTFGNNGTVVSDFAPATSDRANAVAIQADGKIVIAGHDTMDFLVARYNANGTLDASFGTGGVVKTDFYGWRDFGQDLVIQPDGKIVVVGGSVYTTISHLSLARYNANGSLDATFVGNGIVNYDFWNQCGYKHSFGSAVTSLPDGKLLVAGFLGGPCDLNGAFAVYRFKSNGSLDSFEEGDEYADDVATTKVGGAVINRAGLDDRGMGVGISSAAAMAVQPDGRIVVVGTVGIPGSFDQTIALVRYLPDGKRDNSFGTLGRVTTPIPPFASGYDVALQADGKIVVTGDLGSPYVTPKMIVVRYDPAGQLDPSFGSNGVASAAFNGSVSNAVVIQPDGAIVIAGSASYNNASNIALARFTGARPPSSLSVTAIAQKTGGNGGFVTTTVYGVGIQPGASVALQKAGGALITGSNLTYLSKGFGITGGFDLRGAEAGVYDVVVTNPDGSKATLAAAFTVVPGGGAQTWTTVVGPRRARPGMKNVVSVQYGNAGTTDTVIFLTIFVDEDAFAGWGVNPYHGPLGPEDYDINYGDLRRTVRRYNTDTKRWEVGLPMAIYAPAGFSDSIPVPVVPSFRPDGTCPEVHVRATVGDCVIDMLDLASGLIPGHNCVKGMLEFLGFMALRDKFGTPVTLSAALADLLKSIAKCAFEFVPGGKIVLFINDAIETFGKTKAALNSCTGQSEHTMGCVTSGDPNDKTGPNGVGDARYINGKEPIAYSIFFENKPVATAPAQVVTVTDRLDSARVDLDTFALGAIAWGDQRVVPPQGLSSYQTEVDLRPATNLIVRIDASLDKQSGVVTWTFTSLDPATRQLTTDPLAGFLPPNRTAPEGEGSLQFIVKPRTDLADGASVQNMARIVFDTNAPIDTPVWTNTIDVAAPASHVSASATQQCDAFPVNWSGSDAASGVKDFSIYVAENGGAFTQWLRNVSSTAATFDGRQGQTYAFFSVARDHVGHVEDTPATADAVVTVRDTIAPAIAVPAAVTVGTGAGASSCSVVISDAALGSATAADNCAKSPAVTRTGVPAGNLFPLGTTTITYRAVDEAGNAALATQSVTVIDDTPPAIVAATSSVTELWPANHKLVDVTVSAGVTDTCSTATWKIAGVRSNEPENGTGDGDSGPDWEIVDATHVRLRAERAATGTGRIYTIVIEAADARGNRSTREVAVRVPLAAPAQH